MRSIADEEDTATSIDTLDVLRSRLEMNRQVGLCYTICVGIVVFFAIALKPKDGAPLNRLAPEKPLRTSARVDAPAKKTTRTPAPQTR